MNQDIRIGRYIQNKIYVKFTPIAHNIRICVSNGIVTLSGTLKSEIEKKFVEKAVLKVKRVSSVINNIHVINSIRKDEFDAMLAEKVDEALNTYARLHNEHIKIRVKDRWVTLDGEVSWSYQVAKAYNAVRSIEGVKGITNLLTANKSVYYESVLNKISKLTRAYDIPGLKNNPTEVSCEKYILKNLLPNRYPGNYAEFSTVISMDGNKVENLMRLGISIEACLN